MKCLVSVVISHGSWMKSFRLRPSGFVQLQVMYAPLSSSVPQDSGILGGLKVPEVPATFNHQSWAELLKTYGSASWREEIRAQLIFLRFIPILKFFKLLVCVFEKFTDTLNLPAWVCTQFIFCGFTAPLIQVNATKVIWQNNWVELRKQRLRRTGKSSQHFASNLRIKMQDSILEDLWVYTWHLKPAQRSVKRESVYQ